MYLLIICLCFLLGRLFIKRVSMREQMHLPNIPTYINLHNVQVPSVLVSGKTYRDVGTNRYTLSIKVLQVKHSNHVMYIFRYLLNQSTRPLPKVCSMYLQIHYLQVTTYQLTYLRHILFNIKLFQYSIIMYRLIRSYSLQSGPNL